MPDTLTSSVFAKRLKQARLRSGLTQEQLGVLAGIDEFSASARINQYERGKHLPHVLTGQRLARALHVPTSFLYEEDDLLAVLLTVSARLTREKTKTLLAKAETLAQFSPPSRKPK
ncbi:helix-turn-helix transcriptional regulator [Paraburkholderia sp. A1RO-5L]|uniref:helix-turn-helix transcriptional regulator n=1 Tax=unclassified Paraburkholderia TaxID=2615204 RepID=UPI003B77AEA5